MFMHVCTVNYLLRDARFFRELHTEAMQSRKFSRELQEDHATAKLFHRERFALYGTV